ncbi:uncharacterized protein ACNLHF_010250 [Anomaloglossus baeobatrachus]
MIREFAVLLCVLHFFHFTQRSCQAQELNMMTEWRDAWIEATKLNLPSSFKDEYGVAVVLNTMEELYPIYKQLHSNISTTGSYANRAYLEGEKRKDPECNPGYGYGNEVLKETGRIITRPIADSGTFLDCGSSSRLGLYGLILGVVIARLY